MYVALEVVGAAVEDGEAHVGEAAQVEYRRHLSQCSCGSVRTENPLVLYASVLIGIIKL